MTDSMMLRRPRNAFVIAALFTALVVLLAPHAQARTLAEVRALGTISMCAHPDALPYSSQTADNPGIQIELARLIAEGLGVSLSTEWIVPRRRARIVNCDMLLDKPSDPRVTEGRLLLSKPYHKSGVVLGLSKDARAIDRYTELQEGEKIGVMISSVAQMVLGKAGKTTSPYAFQSDMVEDLAKGDLYGIAVSAPTISYYVLQHPDSGLKVAYAFDDVPELTWNVSVGLRNSDEAMVSAVNDILEKLLADGTISRLYAKYGVEHRFP